MKTFTIAINNYILIYWIKVKLNLKLNFKIKKCKVLACAAPSPNELECCNLVIIIIK